MDQNEIKTFVEQLVAEEVRKQAPFIMDTLSLQSTSRQSDIKSALDDNYILYNTTNARSVTPPPRGSLIMIDAGATPNRAIALYLSTGNSLVEVFAKVI